MAHDSAHHMVSHKCMPECVWSVSMIEHNTMPRHWSAHMSEHTCTHMSEHISQDLSKHRHTTGRLQRTPQPQRHAAVLERACPDA